MFDPLQPTIGLRVDIDGSAAVPRRSPFSKIRPWRSLARPTLVTPVGTTLVNETDFTEEVTNPRTQATTYPTTRWEATTSTARHYWLFEKDSFDDLRFKIVNVSNSSEAVAAAGSYNWWANDCVHLRFEWDDSLPVATQLKVFANGVEPNPGGGAGADYVSATNVSAKFQIGRHSPSGGSTGIYDEVRVYGGSGATPTPLAMGGLTSSGSEYLASTTNNAMFSFAAVNGTSQGEYLYFGSDWKFRGLNVKLGTNGVGTGLDLQRQYWDGTQWASLEALIIPRHVAGFGRSLRLLARGPTP